MPMQMDVRYSEEERSVLGRVVDEANRVLDQLYPGYGRRYHVAYIELGARVYDEAHDRMRAESNYFLAGDAREASV